MRGDLWVDGDGDVEVADVVSVGGALYVGAKMDRDGATFCDDDDDDQRHDPSAGLVTASFPALETADEVEVGCTDALTGVAFPLLATVGYKVVIERNAALETIDAGWFPALELIGGRYNAPNNLEIYDNANLATIGAGAFASLVEIWGAVRLVRLPALAGVSPEAFPALDEVGAVEVRVTALPSLAGAFPALADARDDGVVVSDNDALADLAGALPALQTAESVFISNNAALSSLAGAFPALEKVWFSLEIAANPALAEIRGDAFPALAVCHDYTWRDEHALLIADNGNLVSIDGAFAALVEVGDVEIRGEAALASIDAFPNLRIAQRIDVNANDGLEAVAGFDALAEVSQRIQIRSNPALATVGGFGALATVGAQDRGVNYGDAIIVADNPALEAVAGFGALDDVEGRVFVQRTADAPAALCASPWAAGAAPCFCDAADDGCFEDHGATWIDDDDYDEEDRRAF